MILTNILYRVFFIKAEQYGTAFTLDVDGEEFLITARHLLDASKDHFDLKIFFRNRWHDVPATVVGHGRGEIDISVLRLPDRLTVQGLVVESSIAHLTFGQDVYFLGFPYKMWSDMGDVMGGMPCAFAKKGTLSSLGIGDPQIFYVDAINNEGFSGGPLFYSPMGHPGKVHIAGVVSKFKTESENVLDAQGESTDMTVPYNTGFLIAYGVKHAVNLIKRSRER